MNRLTTALLIGLLGISGVMAYPIDGYDYTGIKRCPVYMAGSGR